MESVDGVSKNRCGQQVTFEVAGPFEHSDTGNCFVLILSDAESDLIEMCPVSEISIPGIAKFLIEYFLRFGVSFCEFNRIEERDIFGIVSDVCDRWERMVGSSRWSSFWCSILKKCFETDDKLTFCCVNSEKITRFVMGRPTNTWDKDLDQLRLELRTKGRCFSTMYGRQFVSPCLLVSETTSSDSSLVLTNDASQKYGSGSVRYNLRTKPKAKGTTDLVSEVPSKSLKKRLVQEIAVVASSVKITSALRTRTEVEEHQDVVMSRSGEIEETVIDLETNIDPKRNRKHRSLLPFKCQLCVSTFLATPQDLDLHLKCHAGKQRNLSCPACKQQYKSWVHMERHLVSHPEIASQFSQLTISRRTCDKCKKIFCHRETMLRHSEVVHCNMLRFCCDTCGKLFKERKTYGRHLDVHANVTHECNKCNYKTKISDNLKNHQKIHAGLGFACNVCLKVFSKQSILKIHKKVHDSNGQTVQCEICDARLKCPLTLKQHVRNMHEAGEPFPCSLCSYVGKNKANLVNHLERKHNKPVSCRHCSYSCRFESALKRHIDVFHEGHRPFPCEHCPYRARNTKQLAEHVKFKHKPEALRFPCKLCDRRFKTMTLLRHHTPVHTGQHLYSCKLCSYTAKYRQTLHYHVRKKHPGNLVSETVEGTSASDVIYSTVESVDLTVTPMDEEVQTEERDRVIEGLVRGGIILSTESGDISLNSNIQFHVLDDDQQIRLLSDAVNADSNIDVLFLAIDTESQTAEGQCDIPKNIR